MNPAQALTRWLTGVSAGKSALAEAQSKLEAHVATPPTSAEVAEHRAWLTKRRELEDDVAAEDAALRIAEAKAAEAQRVAAEAEEDAEERRVRKLVNEHAKLTVEISADLEWIAPKLRRHAAIQAEVDAWNAKRGTRPFIQDGEARVREIPAQTRPAAYEEVIVWRDSAGNRPTHFRVAPSGEHVPAQAGYTKHREKIVSRPEQFTPAKIPGGRFKDTIKLIGLKGEALFPPR